MGGNQFHNSGSLGTATSDIVSGLPTDGTTLYTRLFYRINGGIWQFVDNTYTAATGGQPIGTTPPTGTIDNLVDGSTISPSAGSYTIEGTYMDDLSGVDRLDIRVVRTDLSQSEYWNGTDWVTGSSFVDATLTGSEDWSVSGVDFSAPGIYRIQLRIWDVAGNFSSMGSNPRSDFFVQ